MSAAPSDTVKTPLHNEWTLWYDNTRAQQPGESWKDNLKLCTHFNTAEEFWSAFNNVVPASKMSSNSNYHLFKKGVEPSWEDPRNKAGGKWIITIPKQDSRKGKVDEWWLYTILAMIGETMDDTGAEVCGGVVSIRKNQDKLALWVKGVGEKEVMQIGKRWKVALEVSDKTVLKFQSHEDAAKSMSSFKNKVIFEV